MRVALIGAQGQLGSDLRPLLPDCVPLTHADIEITDPASVRRTLDAVRPQAVLNTAAYNLVDQAETDRQAAFAVNETGPRLLAEWCRQSGAKLIHISTDYVFGQDASRTVPYLESDLPGPVSVYGDSKLAGELAVQESDPRHLIIRTCGLYGRNATRAKENFVETMLRLAQDRPELRIVDDQHCTPSFTGDVAAAVVRLIQSECQGLYHVVNAGQTTWHDFAQEIFRLAHLPIQTIPIPSSEYPFKARRPGYSVLNCERLQASTGLPMPDWRNALKRYLQSRPQPENG